ncbi:hypothetical protein DFH09DRAFT_1319496 [Mycena vulgaris]|nr:hypothetical protein DFH09DRAFT_1319496 [Mycena vulgaris]
MILRFQVLIFSTETCKHPPELKLLRGKQDTDCSVRTAASTFTSACTDIVVYCAPTMCAHEIGHHAHTITCTLPSVLFFHTSYADLIQRYFFTLTMSTSPLWTLLACDTMTTATHHAQIADQS